MKILPLILLMALAIVTAFPIAAHSGDAAKTSAMLDNLDGAQALALANEWRWSQPDVVSHITTREVVFKFPSGAVKRVELPSDQVMVAVAPYISQTHK